MVKNKIGELRGKHNEIEAILQDISYSKVDSYIDNKVEASPSAKAFLKKLSKIVFWQVKNV